MATIQRVTFVQSLMLIHITIVTMLNLNKEKEEEKKKKKMKNSAHHSPIHL